MSKYSYLFQGTAFTSNTKETISVLENHLFCINEQGLIERILPPNHEEYEFLLRLYKSINKLKQLPKGHYILPGFIDLHIHAPQWAQSGTALDLPLHDWLHTYTFPLESRFSDLVFARNIYENLVDTLLANGTTTAQYFATIHKESSLLLAQICASKGQRGLVGKVVMDSKDNPTFYKDSSTDVALQDTEEFILAVKELGKSVKQGVYPVVTPRFIPSCTDESLHKLGALAKKYNTHIQSHCSEGDWEHEYVQDRCGQHDAFALHHFGLLGEKSTMAHCNFLSDEDAKLFAQTDTAIGHCPISNGYLANSILPIKKFLHYGIHIGLGTDISGGYSPSIYDNMKQTVLASQILEDGVNTKISSQERGVPNSRISINTAFYLATAGGGESLQLPIGRIQESYTWDIQIVDTTSFPIFNPDEPLNDIFQKIMYHTRSEHIKEVWVQGELVHIN